jgi:transcription antitermination factor NusA-like protein
MEDLEEVVAVIDPEIGNGVEFYPNPVAEMLFIKSEINIDIIQISNVLGQKVMNIIKPQNSEELNVSHLSPGIYVITFVSNDRIWSSEFVKQ